MSGVSEPASPEDEIDPSPGDQLILLRNANPAQTRKFIADMPRLTDADRARLLAVVPD
jgi:hypothetical protein